LVPKELTVDLIRATHDPPLFAHGGIGRTLAALKRNFYWPDMTKDVKNYILSCEVCKTTKSPNTPLHPPMGAQIKSIRPFQRLYVDFLGPYPRSRTGNIGVFIVLDHFSKFPFLHTVKNFSTNSIVNFLETQIFHIFGIPEVILSDNGKQFVSNLFHNLLAQYGITHDFTANHSPQSNNSERVNRTIIAAIRAYIKESDQKTWDNDLSAIAASLRNSFHCSTRFSPYFTLFGQNMILHANAYKLLKDLKDLEEGQDTLDHSDKLKLIRARVQENLNKAYETNKKTYNLRSRSITFEPNEIVFRRNFTQRDKANNINAKLCPKFLKSKVISKKGNHYYELMDMSNNKNAGIFHAKDILKS
jgi:hypothetical protein